jgi:hypothetical protein
MPPHLTAMLDALGLPNVIPEPEVTRKAVASVQCRSLAAVIAELLNDNEPLLKAEANGASVTVRERGGPATMTFTVSA